MKDEFSRINADAHSITDLLNHNFFAAVDRFDDSHLRWYVQELNRMHTNIGEALGRIEKGLGDSARASNRAREGTIRSENNNEERSIPSPENSSPSERDELLCRQQPNDSAPTSSNNDGGSSREEIGTERRKTRESITSDPDLSY